MKSNAEMLNYNLETYSNIGENNVKKSWTFTWPNKIR